MRERCELIRCVVDRVEAHFDDLVDAEIADKGKPERQAREFDVARAVANFRSFVDTVAAVGLASFKIQDRVARQ